MEIIAEIKINGKTLRAGDKSENYRRLLKMIERTIRRELGEI